MSADDRVTKLAEAMLDLIDRIKQADSLSSLGNNLHEVETRIKDVAESFYEPDKGWWK